MGEEKSLITSSECYLYETCPKYKKGECNLASDSYCMRLHKLNSLYELAMLPKNKRVPLKFRLYNTEGDKRDRVDGYKKLQDYCKDIDKNVEAGKNLFIHSSICGNGKTEWALTILRTYLGHKWIESDLKCRGLYVKVPSLLISIKKNISDYDDYAPYILNNVISADLVIFDEVGVKGLTEFEHEQLLNIINTRIDSGKSNVYTSNLTPEELSQSVGPRLASRIISMSEEVELFGADKRSMNSRSTN